MIEWWGSLGLVYQLSCGGDKLPIPFEPCATSVCMRWEVTFHHANDCYIIDE